LHAAVVRTAARLRQGSLGKEEGEVSKRNRFNDPHWGIVRIDLAGLVGAKVYQDMHSQSGLIIDKTDRIPPDLVSQVTP
jgi:hypothetical protein